MKAVPKFAHGKITTYLILSRAQHKGPQQRQQTWASLMNKFVGVAPNMEGINAVYDEQTIDARSVTTRVQQDHPNLPDSVFCFTNFII